MATMLNTWKKNLIQTIVDECNERNVAVSKDLVSFVVSKIKTKINNNNIYVYKLLI